MLRKELKDQAATHLNINAPPPLAPLKSTAKKR